MAQTLTRVLLHLVFSTKNREPTIPSELEPSLYAYMGGICRNLHSPLIAIGGTSDHIHLLVAFGKVVSLADLLMNVKKDSSKWMKTQGVARFAWQEGYGAFSIGESGRAATVRYINNQKEHHRTMTFQEEFVTFLRKYAVPYDPVHIWT